MLGVFDLDDTGRWIDPGEISGALLQRYLQEASVSQDQLAGMNRLPSFEQLSGGRSVQAIQQMGASDNAQVAPAAPGASNTYTFTVPRESRTPALAPQSTGVGAQNATNPVETSNLEEAPLLLEPSLINAEPSIGYEGKYQTARVNEAYAQSYPSTVVPTAATPVSYRR